MNLAASSLLAGSTEVKTGGQVTCIFSVIEDELVEIANTWSEIRGTFSILKISLKLMQFYAASQVSSIYRTGCFHP